MSAMNPKKKKQKSRASALVLKAMLNQQVPSRPEFDSLPAKPGIWFCQKSSCLGAAYEELGLSCCEQCVGLPSQASSN